METLSMCVWNWLVKIDLVIRLNRLSGIRFVACLSVNEGKKQLKSKHFEKLLYQMLFNSFNINIQNPTL